MVTPDKQPLTPFQTAVSERFGVLPNFFCSAPAAAGLIEELWAFARSAYLDSPLPSLFKERLFVHLSRFCEVRYCIVRHVGFLVGEGRPAGDPGAAAESVQQALALLARPVPDAEALDRIYARLRASPPLDAMPAPETQAEADLFDALTVVFLVPTKSMQARAAARHAVGDRSFELLTAFLAFVRTAHYWTETHPELAYEPDVAALMAAHPALADVLLGTREAEDAAQDGELRKALETSENALRESEARHRLLVESWAQAVWETDPQGVVVADSPSWRAYTGQTLDEWLGYGWLNAIYPEDRAYAERQWREAMAAKTLVNAEFRLRSPDGGWRWINIRAAPVLGHGGHIEKWLGMNVDIDARKRAEEALHQSEMLRLVALAGGRMGTWNWDLDAQTCGGDAQFMALWGFPPSDEPRPLSAYTDRMTPVGAAEMAEIVTHAIAAGEEFDGPLEIVAGPRAGHWIRWRGRLTAGSPRMLHGVTFDITEQKRAEERLRESEERQAFLLNLSDALRQIGDPVEIMATASTLTGAHLGLDRCFYGEVDAALEHVYLADSYCAQGIAPFPQRIRLDDFSKEIVAIITTGATTAVADIRNEPRLIDPAQRSRFLAAQIGAFVGVPLTKGGRLVAILSAHQSSARQWTHNDIVLLEEVAERTWAAVERARAETALRESEEQFRAFVDASSDVVYRMSADWSQMRELTGQGFLADTPEPSGNWMERYILPEDRDRVRAAIDRAIGTKSMFELEHRVLQANGTPGWTHSRAVPILDASGEIAEWLGAAKDVTVRKRAEAALRESEERFRQFGEASQDVLWVRDAETFQWEYLTPAFETIYGLDRETALRGDNFANWTNLILPEDRARAVANLEQVRHGEWKTFEYRIRRPSDGGVRWLRNTDFPMRNASGAVQRIGGVGHDITELKRTEDALAAAEQRQRALIEGMPQLVWRAVDGGEWTWASPQWTAFTGQAEADSYGWGWLDALHPYDREAARAAWREAMDRGGLDAEYRVCHAEEGGYRWFHTRASPVRSERGDIVEWLGTSTDIHDLREMQEQQKVLVAELQHRTRNLMGVVRSMSDKTARASADLPDFRERFRDRLEALARVQGLLSRLNEHDRVTFDELIRAELQAMDGNADRVRLEGPAGVRLRSSMVQTLAMAVHELATNAVKYGALGQTGAQLAVTWTLEPDGSGDRSRLHIDWRETGVAMPPSGAKPSGGGQGRELIERALPYQLSAETTYELGPDGVHCTITIPVSRSTLPQEVEHA